MFKQTFEDTQTVEKAKKTAKAKIHYKFFFRRPLFVGCGGKNKNKIIIFCFILILLFGKLDKALPLNVKIKKLWHKCSPHRPIAK